MMRTMPRPLEGANLNVAWDVCKATVYISGLAVIDHAACHAVGNGVKMIDSPPPPPLPIQGHAGGASVTMQWKSPALVLSFGLNDAGVPHYSSLPSPLPGLTQEHVHLVQDDGLTG